TPEAANSVSLEQLMHWDLAPENPGRLAKAGVRIALTAHGLENTGHLWKSIRTAVKRGLDADAALTALTETPAELLGIADRVGTIESGKLAHFVVTDGDLFRGKAKIVETWIGGVQYEFESADPQDIRGDWTVKTKPRFVLHLSGKPKSLKGKLKRDEASVDLKKTKLEGEHFTATFDASVFGKDENGIGRLSAILVPKGDNTNVLTGSIALPSGNNSAFSATWSEAVEEKPAVNNAEEVSSDKDKPDAESRSEEGGEDSDPTDETASDSEAHSTDSEQDDPETESKTEDPIVASFDVNYPLGAFGVDSVTDTSPVVAFVNATVWTCGSAKNLESANVIIRNGVIESVGSDVSVPDGALVIDCKGKHLSPGIIDCHSHMATDGGVNEGSQVITSEVRIGDFIDANDVSIYRQLAGGVTTANVLHGSANPIGGQNQVIKLRWGNNSDGLKFDEAPAGIKFALGENVKRSRVSNNRRYPRTRMGVEQIIRDAFLRARQYRDRRIAWEKDRIGLPPRRDLELDAIVEILDKERWIHCHSYRQDEILALLRTLESFNVRIGTLQHILEGYKIAEAMKQHGAMASSFSDWWAYKFEVYDAIPYNGSIMHNVGVEVSFNSDDRELARHLNHEAAKAVKYGGVDPIEALKFVTLNPAKQLRIDHMVGSLEVGKHADIVVWSGNPLSTLSRCEQTWVDGRKHFDFENDQRNRKKWESMRQTLVQKILHSGSPMKKPGEKEKVAERNYWTRVDIYCTHRGTQRGNQN
ncbi:amidohydrolase family protein, partial [Planctomycetota bacterium]